MNILQIIAFVSTIVVIIGFTYFIVKIKTNYDNNIYIASLRYETSVKTLREQVQKNSDKIANSSKTIAKNEKFVKLNQNTIEQNKRIFDSKITILSTQIFNNKKTIDGLSSSSLINDENKYSSVETIAESGIIGSAETSTGSSAETSTGSSAETSTGSSAETSTGSSAVTSTRSTSTESSEKKNFIETQFGVPISEENE
jgi:hypothetical protein